MKSLRILSFWTDMEEDERRKFILIAGLLLGAFTILTLISCLSYLFTWKADYSLLSGNNIMDRSVEVNNLAGKFGFKWGYFLITKCFGLGSFALIIILFAVTSKLLFKKEFYPIGRTFLISTTGAIIFSLILTFASNFFGGNLAFGGGLGGEFGILVIEWMVNLVGEIITFLLLVILCVVWLFMTSNKISKWIVSIGKKSCQNVEESESSIEDEIYSEVDKEESDYVQDFPLKEEEQYVRPSSITSEIKTSVDPAENMEIESYSISTDVKQPLTPIDNKEELPDYMPLTLDLLEDYASSRQEVSQDELKRNNNKIRATLQNYRIQIADVKAIVGPTVTLYKVFPAPGVKISSIKNLQEDIAMHLTAKGVRVVNLPDSVGIEVANDQASTVPLKAMLNDDNFRNSKAELPVAIGYTITKKVKVFDLADAPHLLVAGATKQGKSVGLNVIVASLLYAKHPSELKLVFIDPKMVEFSSYSRLLKHYLAVMPYAADERDEAENAIIKKTKQAEQVLRSLCIEMDERYELLSKAMVNNIKLYNDKYKARHLLPTEGHHFLPYLVVVIDEYADLTMSAGAGGEGKNMSKSITQSIIRLAQKGRAAGIHVILATQRPSVDVITGLIKTNFPTRIAFRVVTRVDSSTILDAPGADKLIGKGDMLYYAGVEMERVQCAFVSNDEINKITSYIGNQQGYKKSYNTPYYLPAPEPDQAEEGTSMIDMKNLDERFEEAANLIVTSQRGSTSDLQRRLGMGYAKAGRVMDQLEAAGIVGPQEGSKPRQVLVGDLDELSKILSAYKNQE